MRQLPLDIRLADHAVFDSYYAGPNASAVDAIRRAADGERGNLVWLWGPVESGRSHLLQACVEAASRKGGNTAYLPLSDSDDLAPSILDGMDQLDVICVDDAGAVAGDLDWEQQLFRLYEGLSQHRGRMVLAALGPVATLPFALPDLASRFTSGETYRLRPLTDEDRLNALQLRARWRGLELPIDTARYLLSRVDRSAGALFELLDRLDAAALTAQRRLTVPFVKSFLEDQ